MKKNNNSAVSIYDYVTNKDIQNEAEKIVGELYCIYLLRLTFKKLRTLFSNEDEG